MVLHESPIQLTVQDLARLRAVVDLHSEGVERSAAEMLEAELDRAHVVSQEGLPPDVVSMRSRVLYEDADTGDRREAVLVYPEEADLGRSLISVLAPIGAALLGLRAGQAISWPVPGRRTRTIRVLSVAYQPEAAGDRHL
jgi:regulator of nucleoside diphosphate kinase